MCPFSIFVQHSGGYGDEDRVLGGLQIGGRMITNLRCADDIILLATSEEFWIQELHTTGIRGSPRPSQPQIGLYSLLVNVDETKVMASDCTACCILIQNE